MLNEMLCVLDEKYTYPGELDRPAEEECLDDCRFDRLRSVGHSGSSSSIVDPVALCRPHRRAGPANPIDLIGIGSRVGPVRDIDAGHRERPEIAVDLGFLVEVEMCGSLIEKQHLRPPVQSARQQQPLLLPAG